MQIKVNIVNDKFLNISPLAFGTSLINLNEYTEADTVEQTFANIGIYKGKKLYDREDNEYKIVELAKLNEFENRTDETIYRVSLRKLS